MTDEEINRKVAGIEGWRYRNDGQWWQRATKGRASDFYVSFLPPPYATDWAWCGPLVEKYHVNLYGGPAPGRRAACFLKELYDEDDPFDGKPWKYGEETDTPQRAICLAVIAAHEGK